jgi:hypothetical protein
MLTVSRVVVELVPKYHPEGKRFLVKDYPKDKEQRRLKLSRHMADKLAAYITSCEIGEDELLFQLFPSEQGEFRAESAKAEPDPVWASM